MATRIMTFNILDGGRQREGLILKVLQEREPDILVLQEVFEPDLVESLAKSMGMEHFFFAKGNNIRHLGLLSRFPIQSAASYTPFPIRTAILEAQIEIRADKILNLLGIHLTPYPAFYRELRRVYEVKAILKRAAAYDGTPCLILGDCNAFVPNDKIVWVEEIPPFLKRTLRMQGGHVFRKALSQFLDAGYTDCFRSLSKEDGFSLPTPDPHARLDYMFANETLKDQLRSCEVVREGETVDKASDHYPIIAEFDL